MATIRLVIESQIQQLKQTKKIDLLEDLKSKIYSFQTLPPSNLEPNSEEFNLAVNVLEAEMNFYLESKNEDGFEKAFLMIKQFYLEYSYIITETNQKLYYIGLYLLHLLSNNRNTEYCFELEPLNLNDFSNSYIAFIIEVEHCISEGNYNKLLELQRTLTDPNYSFYLSKLSSSIRYQIAKSAEKSFNRIKKQEILGLLMMNNNQELVSFIEKEIQKDDNDILWIFQDDYVIFKENIKDKGAIPSRQIMKDTVNLATEIEKII